VCVIVGLSRGTKASRLTHLSLLKGECHAVGLAASLERCRVSFLLLLLPSTRRTVCTSHEETNREEPTHLDYYLMLLLLHLSLSAVYYTVYIFIQTLSSVSLSSQLI